MQLTLGSKGSYAVRAALDLALFHEAGRRKAREIALAMSIPEKYLPQVLGDLLKAELVTSVAGPKGGYSLARPPADISLLEVVEASEGPVRNEVCLLIGGPCRWEEPCAVHAAWAAAQDSLKAELTSTSLADLVRAEESLRSTGAVSEIRSSAV